MICGKKVYRQLSELKRGVNKTCGNSACKNAYFSGTGNPFWGRTHSDESRRKIKEGRAKNPPKSPGPKKGGFKHTDEAKRRISEASKRLWAEKREQMLASLPRGEDHHFAKEPEERRYRKNFSRWQRATWIGDRCAYCDATDDLVLDHIIPVFDGGTNVESNAQTLCRGCNLWKTYFVDLPRYKANQAAKGA